MIDACGGCTAQVLLEKFAKSKVPPRESNLISHNAPLRSPASPVDDDAGLQSWSTQTYTIEQYVDELSSLVNVHNDIGAWKAVSEANLKKSDPKFKVATREQMPRP